MLNIEADGLTMEELEQLKLDHDIVDRPGFVTHVNARKVGERIVWSRSQMKEGYWKTLQARKKEEESTPVAA